MRPVELDLLGERVAKPRAADEFHTHCMIADILGRAVCLAPGWKYNHIASGEFRTPATAGRLKRMGVMPGWADFILLAPRSAGGRAHFLELKRSVGARLSPAQKAFQAYCAQEGYPYAVCKTFSAAMDQLKEWGAVRGAAYW